MNDWWEGRTTREDRHHLLPDVRWIRRRRDRARYRARARGHEVHFITYKQPFRLPSFLPRIYFHEVDVGRYPLFEYPPYDLALAVRMHEVVRRTGSTCCTCTTPSRTRRARGSRARCCAKTRSDVKVITTLHGTDITIVGQDPSFLPITKFSIEKSDALTAVSQYPAQRDVSRVRLHGCHVEVIYNFIDPASTTARRYPPHAARAAERRATRADARLELPRR